MNKRLKRRLDIIWGKNVEMIREQITEPLTDLINEMTGLDEEEQQEAYDYLWHKLIGE